MAEEELDGCCKVAVWSADADLEAQSFHVVDRLVAGLVRGAVNDEKRVLAPVGILPGELAGKVGDEEAERVLVRVGLGEAAVQLARGADRHLDGDPRGDLLVSDRVALPAEAPFPSQEVGIVQPGLVEVEDSSASLKLPEQEERVLLPQNQAPGRVSEEWDLADLHVARSNIMTEHLPDVALVDLEIVLLQQRVLDLLGVNQASLRVKVLEGLRDDSSELLASPLLFDPDLL